MSPTVALRDTRHVPQTLIRALFRDPQALQSALSESGLAPHELAIWARQSGTAPELEKLAGWLSVGQRPGHYKPLLEVAASHLRAGELLDALPVFRWAYRAWLGAPVHRANYTYDGAKLLALWGECLYRIGQPGEALERWLWALSLVPDGDALSRLARSIERLEAQEEYEAVLSEALRRGLPGARDLWQRWQRLATAESESSQRELEADAGPDAPGLAVMADVANLDMVCRDQFGASSRLDYGRLLRSAGRLGPVQAQIAFVPDIPETLSVRRHLAEVGFQIDLKRPKRSHGRIVANADTAMAAAAVRWASEATVGRVELWTGDGDFIKVREVAAEAWPDVAVTFRSFEVGTAAAIRRLGADWRPIGAEYLQQ